MWTWMFTQENGSLNHFIQLPFSQIYLLRLLQSLQCFQWPLQKKYFEIFANPAWISIPRITKRLWKRSFLCWGRPFLYCSLSVGTMEPNENHTRSSWLRGLPMRSRNRQIWWKQMTKSLKRKSNKLAKARKTRTSPSTLGLKKFGLGTPWVKKVFRVKNVFRVKKCFFGSKKFFFR